jgi:phospholipase C
MRLPPLALGLVSLTLGGLGGCSSSSSSDNPSSDGGAHGTADAALDARADGGGDAEIKPPTDTAAEEARQNCTYDVGSLALATQGASAPDGSKIPIDTIVIVMMENRSFDHYFQGLAAEGRTDVDVAPAGASNLGVDGTPVPFARGTQLCFADTNHSWDGTHQEINGGKMDGFAVANDGTHEDPMLGPPDFLSGARAMAYYTRDDLPLMYWAADNFAIGDRYFASVPGPTFPNREYLYAATSFGETTTSLAYLPKHVTTTVLDSLDSKGVSWGAYTDDDPSFFLFTSDARFPTYSKKQGKIADFTDAAAKGTLPHVVFIDPNLLEEGYDDNDEHPPAVMKVGQNWLAGIVQSLIASPQWPHLAMFLLYDEHGGLYDHVPPPKACAPDSIAPILSDDAGSPYGGFDEYGVRLPFVTFSPYAKRRYVSHKVFDHTSVLRFIEARFELPALTKRDANALAPWDVFDFSAAPNLTPPAVPSVPVDETTIQQCQTIFTAPDVVASPYAE